MFTKDQSGLSVKLNQAFEKNIVLNFSVEVGELLWKLCNPFVCSGLRGSRLPKRKIAKSDVCENATYIWFYVWNDELVVLFKMFPLIFSIMRCHEFNVTLSRCHVAFSRFQIEAFILNIIKIPSNLFGINATAGFVR